MGLDRQAIKEEAWAVAGIALPIIVTNALLMLLQVSVPIIETLVLDFLEVRIYLLEEATIFLDRPSPYVCTDRGPNHPGSFGYGRAGRRRAR